MRLVGYVEGVEIGFTFYPPNEFRADVPAQLSGTYTIELKAIDDAGNQAYYNNVFVEIDFKAMSFTVLKGFSGREMLKSYDPEEAEPTYSTAELQDTPSFTELDQEYTYKEVNEKVNIE